MVQVQVTYVVHRAAGEYRLGQSIERTHEVKSMDHCCDTARAFNERHADNHIHVTGIVQDERNFCMLDIHEIWDQYDVCGAYRAENPRTF